MKQAGGVFIPTEVLRRHDLGPAQKLLLGLLENLSRRSGIAYASVATYAARLGLGRRTVQRLLHRLETLGLICQEQPGGGRGLATVYRLRQGIENPDKLADLGHENPAAFVQEPGRKVRSNTAKSGQEPGQVDAPVNMSKHMSEERVNSGPDAAGPTHQASHTHSLRDAQDQQTTATTTATATAAATDTATAAATDTAKAMRSAAPVAPLSVGNPQSEIRNTPCGGADADRVLFYAFPSGRPNPRAEAACRDRIAEALRLGATPQLLAWAVGSPKARGRTPWDRIQEAGERTAELLARVRKAWPKLSGLNLADLLAHVPPGWRPPPATPAPEEPEWRLDERRRHRKAILALAADIDAWRQQANTWP